MGALTDRLVKCQDATLPQMPSGLLSAAQSGKQQFRAVQHVGREWTETYGIMDLTNVTDRAFLSDVDAAYRAGTILNMSHPKFGTLLGAGGGTPLVNGASQVGSSILTDGWPNSTTVLRVGDLVQFDAIAPVYTVTTDVASNGSGEAAIPITPPIFAGGSPANNAIIFTGLSVGWRVRIVAMRPAVASYRLAGRVEGLQITLREALAFS